MVVVDPNLHLWSDMKFTGSQFVGCLEYILKVLNINFARIEVQYTCIMHCKNRVTTIKKL